jgi:transcriptional regulator with XRE-family HTH domain
MPEMRKSAKPTLDTRYTVQLGSQIRELRKARDWTQKHLASLIRVSEGQISKYEAGANSPPPLTLARLARSFGLPVDALLPEVSDTPLDLLDRELRGQMRRLIALPPQEKEAASNLLRAFLGLRDLLVAPAVEPPRSGGQP